MQSDINTDILHGIYEYLKTRIKEVFIYGSTNTHGTTTAVRTGYIEARRNRTFITITIADNIAELEMRRVQPEGTSYTGPLPQSRTTIDMQSPDSLQKIFEWIMSKQNK